MTFSFEPALQLTGTPSVLVRSLHDAAGVLRRYVGHRPATRDTILRRVDKASTEQESCDAATSFRWWAEQEGLLLQPIRST
jgi:hypothetical protein